MSVVGLAVFRAKWQPDRPLYAPQRVRFHFGLVPNQPTDSFEFEVAQHTGLQKFAIPRPVLATWMCVELIGRTKKQPYDHLYYTVISTGNIRSPILLSNFICLCIMPRFFKQYFLFGHLVTRIF